MEDKERLEYCKDCERSIYGRYKNCDINIQNKGMYVMSNKEWIWWGRNYKITYG